MRYDPGDTRDYVDEIQLSDEDRKIGAVLHITRWILDVFVISRRYISRIDPCLDSQNSETLGKWDVVDKVGFTVKACSCCRHKLIDAFTP